MRLDNLAIRSIFRYITLGAFLLTRRVQRDRQPCCLGRVPSFGPFNACRFAAVPDLFPVLYFSLDLNQKEVIVMFEPEQGGFRITGSVFRSPTNGALLDPITKRKITICNLFANPPESLRLFICWTRRANMSSRF